MEHKTEVVNSKAKELWNKHGKSICVGGMCVCSYVIGREIGRVEGYAKCLVNLIKIAVSSGEAK